MADSREEQVKQFVALADRLIAKTLEESLGHWDLTGLARLTIQLDEVRRELSLDEDDFPAFGVLPVFADLEDDSVSDSEVYGKAGSSALARWFSLEAVQAMLHSQPAPTDVWLLYRCPGIGLPRTVSPLNFNYDGCATEATRELAEEVVGVLKRWIRLAKGDAPVEEPDSWATLSPAAVHAREVLDRVEPDGASDGDTNRDPAALIGSASSTFTVSPLRVLPAEDLQNTSPCPCPSETPFGVVDTLAFWAPVPDGADSTAARPTSVENAVNGPSEDAACDSDEKLKGTEKEQAKRDPSTYSIPDDYERDRWIYEQRLNGQNNRQIIDALSKNKKRWNPLTSEDSIRDAIKRYCYFHRLEVPQGRRGRPTNKNQETPDTP